MKYANPDVFSGQKKRARYGCKVRILFKNRWIRAKKGTGLTAIIRYI